MPTLPWTVAELKCESQKNEFLVEVFAQLLSKRGPAEQATCIHKRRRRVCELERVRGAYFKPSPHRSAALAASRPIGLAERVGATTTAWLAGSGQSWRSHRSVNHLHQQHSQHLCIFCRAKSHQSEESSTRLSIHHGPAIPAAEEALAPLPVPALLRGSSCLPSASISTWPASRAPTPSCGE